MTGACSSSSGADAGQTGGPVTGQADTHCQAPDGAMNQQPTSQAACNPDLGTADLSGSGGATYGGTLYNAEGNDDDCKYHVKFTVSAVRQNQDVTFTVTPTSRVDGKPVTGAQIRAEVFLSDTHPAPNAATKTTEQSGVYTIGPVHFDAAGRWTVRFHLFEDCADVAGDLAPRTRGLLHRRPLDTGHCKSMPRSVLTPRAGPLLHQGRTGMAVTRP